MHELILAEANKKKMRGDVFRSQGKKEKAVHEYLKALELYREIHKKGSPALKDIAKYSAHECIRKIKSLENHSMEEAAKQSLESETHAVDWILREKPKVRFSDIGGLEGVIEELKMKTVYPLLDQDKARKLGIEAGGGVLLYGPPGTGKTTLAKAVASEVGAPFYVINPGNIMSKWVGESEKRVKMLFEEARRQGMAVIFIDDADSLLPRRTSGMSTVMRRVVPQFLVEWDGIQSDGSKILILGATNMPWALDPAVLRPRRFDKLIYVPPPDFEARKAIFKIHLKDRECDGDIDFDELAELTEGYTGADIEAVCRKAAENVYREYIKSGKTIDRGISMADLLAAITEVPPSVTEEDLKKYEEFTQRFGRM